jgi:DNA-binding NarL/FixJ family response regulator
MTDLRVLIADDHVIYRRTLKRLLATREGIVVVGEAEDGEEAVKLARELQPDVVLMDISMPRMDGVEATREITAANPSLPVVMLTMYIDEEYMRVAVDAGARAFLLKDVESDELVEVLRSTCRGGRREGSGGRESGSP